MSRRRNGRSWILCSQWYLWTMLKTSCYTYSFQKKSSNVFCFFFQILIFFKMSTISREQRKMWPILDQICFFLSEHLYMGIWTENSGALRKFFVLSLTYFLRKCLGFLAFLWSLWVFCRSCSTIFKAFELIQDVPSLKSNMIWSLAQGRSKTCNFTESVLIKTWRSVRDMTMHWRNFGYSHILSHSP